MSTLTETRTVVTVDPPSLLFDGTNRSSARPLDSEARRDLLVDKLAEHLTADRLGYQLDEWFTSIVSEPDVHYRHEVFRDLDLPGLRAGIADYCRDLLRVRQILTMASRLSYDLERQRWFLDAATSYTSAVRTLSEVLHSAPVSSTALRGVSAWLEGYVDSPAFHELAREAAELSDRLDGIRYRLRVQGDRVQVRPVDPAELAYATELLATFERFRQADAPSYLKEIRDPGSMDHVEAAITGFVAKLHPEAFGDLKAFCGRHRVLVLPALARLEREAQFYLAWLDLVDQTSPRGVTWNLPDIAADHHVTIAAGHDLLLALRKSPRPVVPNDCELADQERRVLVTGPNQGGKTTFARLLGLIHALAAMGVPVPARQARLPLVDQVFTVFERGENLNDMRGHLQDDLVRARKVVDQATEASLVLLNEAFASTSPDDALHLASDLLTRIDRLGARCVCVTFLDELSRLTPDTVSLVAGVDPATPTRRTYVVTRRPADGLAYAHALAQQHGLTREDLARRLHR